MGMKLYEETYGEGGSQKYLKMYLSPITLF
jgi:hypothetical protein